MYRRSYRLSALEKRPGDIARSPKPIRKSVAKTPPFHARKTPHTR